jgi:hypothetical protein
LEDQKNIEKEKKNYQLYELAKTKGIEVKVMEVERTVGTSKLIAIVLRRMGAQVGRLEVDAGGGSCWLRSHGCSLESPLERENAKGWSLRVEDECSEVLYL